MTRLVFRVNASCRAVQSTIPVDAFAGSIGYAVLGRPLAVSWPARRDDVLDVPVDARFSAQPPPADATLIHHHLTDEVHPLALDEVGFRDHLEDQLLICLY